MPDPPETDEPSRKRPRDVARNISQWSFWSSAKGILTAAAALVAVLAFLLRFWPSSESCDANSAALSNPQVHAGTLRSFLERTSPGSDPTAGYDPEKLDDPVTWASVAVSVVGHKGKYLALKWSMVHAGAGASGALPDNRTAVEFRPPGCERTGFREEVLLPPIPRGRRVYVTFDLVDESNERLPPEEVTTPVVRAS